MSWDIGAVVALIALIVVIAGHLCTTVWWMSKLSTTLDRMSRDVAEAASGLKEKVAKEDCDKTHAHCDKSFDSLWDAIKELRKA
jgi:hypothetical protein